MISRTNPTAKEIREAHTGLCISFPIRELSPAWTGSSAPVIRTRMIQLNLSILRRFPKFPDRVFSFSSMRPSLFFLSEDRSLFFQYLQALPASSHRIYLLTSHTCFLRRHFL